MTFVGEAGHNQRVLCAISREALEDHFGADGKSAGLLNAFRNHRQDIEQMARLIDLERPVPADGAVLLTSADVVALREQFRRKRFGSHENRRATISWGLLRDFQSVQLGRHNPHNIPAPVEHLLVPTSQDYIKWGAIRLI